MKTRNTITKLITMIMTVAVLCGGVLLQPANMFTTRMATF
jgi:preprotein translocase subunit SecG